MKMPKLITSLVNVIYRPKRLITEVQNVGFSFDPATIGKNSQAELLKGVLESEQITHQDMCNLSKTFLNVEVKSNLFCFRSGGPYGLVMGIENVSVTKDDLGRVDNIYLYLVDVTMDSSLKVYISVKDIDEMLRPFFPRLPVAS